MMRKVFFARVAPAMLVAVGVVLGGATATAPPPADQETIYSGEATGILGRSVFGPDNEQVGRIVDVLVDDRGQPRAVVIDFGGFMGIGKRRIAVAWRALRFLPAAEAHHIRIDLTIDQIKATPDYRPSVESEGSSTTMAVPPATPAPAPAELGK